MARTIDRRQARFLVALSSLLFSIGALSVKILPEAQPLTITFFRSLSGAIVLGLYIASRNRMQEKAEGTSAADAFSDTDKPTKPTGRILKSRHVFETAGGIAYAATTLSFFTAVRYTTAANATILQHSSPIWVALLGLIFLKERTFFRDWLSIAFILFGIFLCLRGDFNSVSMQGNIYALASGLSFSILVIIMRAGGGISSLRSLIIGNIITILVSAPVMIRDDLTAKIILIGLFLGVFQFALPFILYNIGLMRIRAVETTIIKTVEPVVSPVWVALVVGEIPAVTTVLGGILVITVIVLWSLATERSLRAET